uniref:Uncharacterized protein n=1 Tax=Cyanistes caeruleus TaxID=156563 RepID=A0A8C0U413_CYACU
MPSGICAPSCPTPRHLAGCPRRDEAPSPLGLVSAPPAAKAPRTGELLQAALRGQEGGRQALHRPHEVWGWRRRTWCGTRPAVRERPALGPPEVWQHCGGLCLAARLRVTELCWAFRDSAAPLLQMLWGRLDIQANGTIRLRDEELASLRPARRFLQILEEEVPKTPAEIEQHLRYYSLTDTPLPPTEFERLLFTSVYRQGEEDICSRDSHADAVASQCSSCFTRCGSWKPSKLLDPIIPT